MVTTIKRVGYRHSHDEILDAAVATAFDVGLSRLTFGRVAARLGIADRTVVYYFPTKGELVSEVVAALGERLLADLTPALSSPADDHLEVVRRTWHLLSRPESDATFGLFFEANGLAAAGVEPFSTLVPRLVEGWIDWVSSVFGESCTDPRAEAEAAIALVDGLVLVRLLVGPDAGDRAAERLGVTGRQVE